MAQDNLRNDDSVQHGIDDDAHDDGKKALGLGAVGGGTVGAIAGSALGPLGTLVGAAIGGTIGSLASGAAVDAVDAVDNDNTVSGVGSGVHDKGDLTRDSNDLSTDYSTVGTGSSSYGSGMGTSGMGTGTDAHGHNVVTGDEAETDAGKGGLATGALVGGLIGTAVGGPVGAVVGGTLGSLAGGVAGDASEVADDTSTRTSTGYGTTMNTPGNNTPGVQTGGMTTAGADTRGITEKIADTVTGNPVDDKTGGVAGGVMGTGMGSGMGVGAMGGYYGEYEGRNITRDEYDRMPENDRMKVRLLEETLNVGKESRQVGEVEVTKRVVEEQVQVPVTLEREEIVIHRHSATGSTDATGQIIGADSETIVVPVREEFANVTKDVRVTEELEIEKRTISEQKTISDTVRHEEVDIQGATGANVRVDDTTGRNI